MHRIVGHRIGRAEQRDEVRLQRKKEALLPRLRGKCPDRHQPETKYAAEAKEGRLLRQQGKGSHRGADGGKGRAEREASGRAIGRDSHWCEQRDADRGKYYERRSAWPCGHNPHERCRADRQERTDTVYQCRQHVTDT